MRAQIQAVRRARRGIGEIHRRLLSPTAEAVGACAAPLTEAIRCMETLQGQLLSSGPMPGGAKSELAHEMAALRQELSLVNALLRSAADFHQGYGRLLRSCQDPGVDYSRSGPSLRAPDVARLIVHG